MQNFFNKIGKTASEAASKAGSKASELTDGDRQAEGQDHNEKAVYRQY